jgi:hypothetical protein
MPGRLDRVPEAGAVELALCVFDAPPDDPAPPLSPGTMTTSPEVTAPSVAAAFSSAVTFFLSRL